MPSVKKASASGAAAVETVEATTGQWGNNLGVRLPSALVRRLRLRSGEKVSITVARAKRRPTLKELCDSMTPKNQVPLVDWGKPVGKEVW